VPVRRLHRLNRVLDGEIDLDRLARHDREWARVDEQPPPTVALHVQKVIARRQIDPESPFGIHRCFGYLGTSLLLENNDRITSIGKFFFPGRCITGRFGAFGKKQSNLSLNRARCGGGHADLGGAESQAQYTNDEDREFSFHFCELSTL
jgi:hypothetical protein